MSYSCFISFKKMKEKDIIAFFRNFKHTTSERLKEIAVENHGYCPYIRKHLTIPEKFTDISVKERDEAEAWARMSVFQYKYFYDNKNKMLCVYGVPTCMRDMFDGTVYFQNSCDQDYERESWDGVDALLKIFDKWQNYSDAFIKTYYRKKYHENFDEEYDGSDEKIAQSLQYFRRTFAYDEIWGMYKNTLYDDEDAIYIALYGGYEFAKVESFVKYCHEHQVGEQKEYEEKMKKENLENDLVW